MISLATFRQYDRIGQLIYAGAWLLCFSLPLPYWNGRVAFFSSVIFLLWFLEGNLSQKFSQLAHQKLFVLLLIFLGYNALSLLWTDNLRVGLETLKPYKYFLLVLPPLVTSIPQDKLPRLVLAFVLGTLFHAILAYGAIFFDLGDAFTSKIYTPYAIYAPFTAFSSLYFLNKLIQSDKQVHTVIVHLALFLILLVLLFIKPGRSGQIGFVVSLGVLIFLYYYGKTIKTISLITICFITISVIVLNIGSTKKEYFLAKQETANVIQNKDFTGSWGCRFGFILSGLEIVKKNPLFGTGIGDSRDAFQRVYERGRNPGFYTLAFYDGPHNQYLTFLTKTGLVGLALFVTYIVMLFRLDILDAEMKTLSILFASMFAFNCVADEIMFMKPYNIYFAMMSGIFMRAARGERAARSAKALYSEKSVPNHDRAVLMQ